MSLQERAVGGFRSLDQELGWPPYDRSLGEIVEVNFGDGTDWRLEVKLEGLDRTVWVIFQRPTSFRVHDESEILAYRSARGRERGRIGNFYEIANSPYLDEMKLGVSGVSGQTLRQFLVASDDLCVEVICAGPPTLAGLRPPRPKAGQRRNRLRRQPSLDRVGLDPLV